MIKILSGAGISKDAGIDTYRDRGGLWDQYKSEVVTTLHTYKENRTKSLEFHNKVTELYSNIHPSSVHYGFKQIEDLFETIHFTQNVDDLLEKAGCENVVHVHGKRGVLQCLECGHFEDHHKQFELTDICNQCNSNNTKPGVVYFGENAPKYTDLYKEMSSCTEDDIIIIAGTAGEVIPISNYLFGRNNKSHKILINLEQSRMINEIYFNKVFYGKMIDTMSTLIEYLKDIKK